MSVQSRGGDGADLRGLFEKRVLEPRADGRGGLVLNQDSWSTPPYTNPNLAQLMTTIASTARAI